MKVCIIFSVMSVLLISCTSAKRPIQSFNREKTCCSVTSGDSIYNKRIVLDSFVETLNLLNPVGANDRKEYYVDESCRLIGAFIWDVTDTLNKEIEFTECIVLKEGHVYHFSPISESDSYSNIAILNKGRVKVFRAINCPEKGDQLVDAIHYINDSLPVPDKAEVINHLRNYRHYGKYLRIDPQSVFRCK